MKLHHHKNLLACVDPGTTHSGFVVFNGIDVLFADSHVDNEALLHMLASKGTYDHMAIEMVASYGMAVGKSVFETVFWIGRFVQAFGGSKATRVYRKDVKLWLCGTPRAKDANVRRAVLDMFPQTGGGAEPAKGIKSKPGPLYGVKSHAISALAVGLYWFYGDNGFGK